MRNTQSGHMIIPVLLISMLVLAVGVIICTASIPTNFRAFAVCTIVYSSAFAYLCGRHDGFLARGRAVGGEKQFMPRAEQIALLGRMRNTQRGVIIGELLIRLVLLSCAVIVFAVLVAPHGPFSR